MDPLFPGLPKKLTELSQEELDNLLAEHEEAAGLIKADDEAFLKGLSADEIIEQYRAGAEQIKTLRAEVEARAEAHENFVNAKAEIDADLTPKAEEPEPEGDEPNGEEPEAEGDVVAEAEAATAEAADDSAGDTEAEEAEKVLVAAAEDVVEEVKPRLARKPPAPAADRVVVEEPKPALGFVASGLLPTTPPGTKFADLGEIVQAEIKLGRSIGKPSKNAAGKEERYPVAQLDYSSAFPEERVLSAGDWEANSRKIRAVGSPYLGREGMQALLASGGLCAPLEPIYTMPQLAVQDRPVRDALPNFRAERGGISVPTPTTMGDAAGAITIIEEADDALGGTFATKACLDMSCPEYVDVAVTIIAHCREFGNLNAMAWPEKIAHENELTMAEHARAAETYLLERIKALSVNVTNGAETLGALIYLVDAIAKGAYGIRSRLRMPREARFVALMPAVILDILILDAIQNQFDRYKTRGDVDAYLRSIGVDPVYYLDGNFAAGDDQIADASQTAAAIDGFPDTVQWALFPAGTFLHLDMAELNLGIVRDSTLNSTNDFQVFGESFENVARIGPAQAAYWVTSDICAAGLFPPAGTARTCD